MRTALKFTLLLLLIFVANLLAVPNTINFQGALKDANGEPVNDTKFMQFKIYPESTGGSALWNESLYDVEISDGIFSVELGKYSSFPPLMFNNNDELYITFIVGGEEMTPRQKLLAVPYARKADIASNLDGSLDSVYVNKVGPDTISASPALYEGVLNINHTGLEGYGLQITTDSNMDAGIRMVNISNDGVYLSDINGYAFRANNGYSHFRSHSSENFGLEVYNSGNHGITMAGIGGDGIHIESTNGDGVFVLEAGNPSAQSPSNSKNGVEIAGAEGNGVYIGQADETGVYINSANYSGVYIDSVDNSGVQVFNSAGNGFTATYAGDNGFYVNSAGDPYMTSWSTYSNGFQVAGAEDYGLYVGYAGRSGVYVDTTDNSGLKVNATANDGVYVNSAGDDGVYVLEAGSDGGYFNGDYRGIYCNTFQATSEWGLYTNDKIYADNVSSKSISTHAKYSGSQPLEPGDLVFIAGGYEKNVLGKEDNSPVINVTKANSQNSDAVFGVVEYKVKISEEIQEANDGETKSDKSFRYAPGGVMPGDYLSVIVFGPTDVKVDNDADINIGESLVASDNGARKIKTTRVNGIKVAENTGVIGKSLEKSDGSNKLKVFVNCK